MRWFVEISSLGAKAGSTTTLCVEAKQWQPALQKARAIRGDTGPLSNFSIELLEDGYKAVDPSTRLRYLVKRAPDDAPLTEGAPPSSSSPPVSSAPSSEPAKEPEALARDEVPTKPEKAEKPEKKKRETATTVAYASKGEVVVELEAPKAAEPAKETRPAPKPAPALPKHEIVIAREEDPSDRSPLTYREIAYAVAPGTSEEDAERLLRDRLEHLRAALASVTSGRFFNLAVFDHTFQGRPQRRPLVTLSWKDWKSDPPEIRFPLREGATERASAPPTSRASAPAPVSAKPEPVTAKPEPVTAKPEPVTAKPEPVAVKPEPVAAKPEPEETKIPVEAAEEPPAPVKAAAPPAPEPPAPKPAAASKPTPAAAPKPQPAPARDAPPPSKRLSGDDLIVELFEAFGDLHFLSDSLQGAEFVLALTLEKLPCEVGLVSLFDINKREFVVVRQSGGSGSALCARQSERAPLASAVMRKGRAVVVSDPEGTDRATDERWRSTGVTLKSLLCAPVALGGRYLGLIEVANPLEGGVFTESDGNALTYIGQQFAEFVGARGVIVDPELIKGEPPAPEKPAPAPAPVKKATVPRPGGGAPAAKRR